MDQPISYDEDFLAWSEQQAAALRELAGRRGLPDELDLEHVAGRSRIWAGPNSTPSRATSGKSSLN
jgi:hypothetical protein